MKIYLVSNNLLLEGLVYGNDANLELIRMCRCLNNLGEEYAKKLSNAQELNSVEKIYASFYSSAQSTAKYLAEKLELKINLDESLNDCKVGLLGSKNMKMVKGLQDHVFTYRLPNGESLNDVGERINNFIHKISLDKYETILFTHKRAILGFLLKYAKVDYNLDDNLILQYHDKIIYDDSDSALDIYEVTIENEEIIDINKL